MHKCEGLLMEQYAYCCDTAGAASAMASAAVPCRSASAASSHSTLAWVRSFVL
jgi:hypothetical protein